MTQEEVITRLREHESPEPSKWKEEAEWRRDNSCWIRIARKIAIRISGIMELNGIDEKKLAELSGWSEKEIRDLLCSKINLTLSQICQLETALNANILKS
ncbi:MAG: hypothetical protein LUD72_04535 [Bacteroidales bacterium]|nr:hypothetical protein [Bacteroidales bacterium]